MALSHAKLAKKRAKQNQKRKGKKYVAPKQYVTLKPQQEQVLTL